MTANKDRADYAVILEHEGGKEPFSKDNKFALFNKDGDVIKSGSTRSLGNAVKETCRVILNDWKEPVSSRETRNEAGEELALTVALAAERNSSRRVGIFGIIAYSIVQILPKLESACSWRNATASESHVRSTRTPAGITIVCGAGLRHTTDSADVSLSVRSQPDRSVALVAATLMARPVCRR